MTTLDLSTSVPHGLARFACKVQAFLQRAGVHQRIREAVAVWQANYGGKPHPFAWRTGAYVALSGDRLAFSFAERLRLRYPLAKRLEPRDCIPDLIEKYVCVAAFHDHACRTSEPIHTRVHDLKQDRTRWRYHLMVVEHASKLNETDLPHLENCLSCVKADMQLDHAEVRSKRPLPGRGISLYETNNIVREWLKKNVGEGKRYSPEAVRIRTIEADTERPRSSIGKTRAWQGFQAQRKKLRVDKNHRRVSMTAPIAAAAQARSRAPVDELIAREEAEAARKQLIAEQAKDSQHQQIHLND